MNDQQQASDTLSNLVQGALADIEKLIGQQFDQMRSEIKEDLKHVGGGAGSLLAGSGAGAVSCLLGTLAVVYLVRDLTGLPLSVCYGLVGGGLGLTAAGLIGTGVKEIAKVNLLPRHPVRAVKEALTGHSA